jgi:hypothetical protein
MSRMEMVSAEKVQGRLRAYTRMRKIPRQNVLFMMAAPYKCEIRLAKGSVFIGVGWAAEIQGVEPFHHSSPKTGRVYWRHVFRTSRVDSETVMVLRVFLAA